MQIKTIIAGAFAGICLAAPVIAADGHDDMRHEVSNLSGTLTGSVLDAIVSGRLDLGSGYSGGVDSTVDPYTAAARAEEARRDRAEKNARIERQSKIKRDLARAEARSKAKHKADKASRSKRSDRQKSASRERRRSK